MTLMPASRASRRCQRWYLNFSGTQCHSERACKTASECQNGFVFLKGASLGKVCHPAGWHCGFTTTATTSHLLFDPTPLQMGLYSVCGEGGRAAKPVPFNLIMFSFQKYFMDFFIVPFSRVGWLWKWRDGNSMLILVGQFDKHGTRSQKYPVNSD